MVKAEVLKTLKETEGYVSGQELCSRLQISRTAVWKAVEQLREEGFQIEAVRSRGYRLTWEPDVLTEPELCACIHGRWAGRHVRCYQVVDSTNIRTKQLAEEGAPHGTLVVAEDQTGGRGRRGKAWLSQRGTGIFLSLLLRPKLNPAAASALTLVAAMAVTAGIEEATGLRTQIKWPNDIVCRGRKLCGILTEMSAEMDEIHYVVVGIGINANVPCFPDELAATATSLRLETGAVVRRSAVVASVMKWMEYYYEQYMETEDLSLIKEAYEERLVSKGGSVEVLSASGSYRGVCLGIDKGGELLVRTEDEGVRTVSSGEVSVRGIYGYV